MTFLETYIASAIYTTRRRPCTMTSDTAGQCTTVSKTDWRAGGHLLVEVLYITTWKYGPV